MASRNVSAGIEIPRLEVVRQLEVAHSEQRLVLAEVLRQASHLIGQRQAVVEALGGGDRQPPRQQRERQDSRIAEPSGG
jgi:hypothetical protein